MNTDILLSETKIGDKTLAEIKYSILHSFRDLKFNEEEHIYSVDKEEIIYEGNNINISLKTTILPSCTTLNKKLAPFDANTIANKKAKELGVKAKDLIDAWAEKGKIASENGTLIHYRIEQKILDETYDFDRGSNQTTNDLLNRFYKWLMDNYIPIITECRMYSMEYGVAGTSDLIAYNKKTGKLAIIDYKTGKDIIKIPTYKCKRTGKMRESKFMLEPPFSDLHNSNFNKYSIQLSEYKAILKKECGLVIDELLLVHFSDSKFTPIIADKINVSKIFNKNK